MESNHHSGLWRILDRITTIVMLLAAGTVVWTLHDGSGAVTTQNVRSPAALPSEPISISGAPKKGDPRSPFALVVFGDFQCPYCARFARDTLPTIEGRYVATKKLLVAFVHMPLQKIHPDALQAAEAAECAARGGRFWEMHDRLFEHPKELKLPRLRQDANQVGLDLAAFDSCLGSDVRRKIITDMTAARAASVRGTPALLMGRLMSQDEVQVLQRIDGIADATQLAKVLEQMFVQRSD